MTADASPMTSHRPYLLRALYEWIADNGMTPHLLVDATRAGVQVPAFAVKDGRIVLNVADRAVSRLEMTNEAIRFSARFGGVSHAVHVPVAAVLAIYARENGQGMALPDELGGEAEATPTGELAAHADAGEPARETARDAPAVVPHLAAVPTQRADDDSDGDPPPTPPTRPGGFKLRVVK